MAEGLLLDIDGVIVTSWEPLPGAVEALESITESGIPRMFLTNTTSKSRNEIAQTLIRGGFDVEAREILTAAVLTAEYLRSRHEGKRVVVLNEGPISEDMDGINVVSDDPEVLVFGGAGPSFTHELLSQALAWMIDGVPAISMHRSMSWSTASGPKIDTGIYLEGLQKATGKKIPAIGKPSPLGFRHAVEMLGVGDPGEVIMVGDDIHGDVLGAQKAAMIGVLVRTGKFRPEQLDALNADEFGQVPDHVIDSIADLPALLEKL
ncbi:HAD-IIA family hydrolase [Williamsia sp.]|uniref:HAD-IIA family hydrolase n=1 Tax=Williamsia sp. TaxID=1872085 RepID=UPI002F92BA5D